MRKHFLMTTLLTAFFLGFLSCEKDPASSKIGPLYLIEVMPPALNVEIDSTYKFSAIGRDASMNVIEDISYTWTSRYQNVGTVDQNGLFTALSSGMTFLTAKSGTVESAQVTVSIYDPVFSIEILQDSLTVYYDSTAQFTAVGKDMNGDDITGLSFTWESANTDIATINNDGVLTGIIVGSTSVTAKLRDVESLPAIANVKATTPKLITAEVTDILQSTALCGGAITSDGGAEITARGVCWNTSQTPTVDDDKSNDGTGAGSFTSYITGLTASTTYYVRAYATNSAGTGYGSTMSFTTEEALQTGTVTDIDGNTYQTVKIGDQWWMAENLKVTHYRNGDAIPNVTDVSEWSNLTTGAYCNYNNDDNNANTYGSLYNWYAVDDSRNIAPDGWHVPTDAKWQTLVDYLGGDAIAGGKMKETGTSHWKSPNTGATNESGFSALPGGYRGYTGLFADVGDYAYFWSSKWYGSTAWYRGLLYDYSGVYRGNFSHQNGYSVRCVRD